MASRFLALVVLVVCLASAYADDKDFTLFGGGLYLPNTSMSVFVINSGGDDFPRFSFRTFADEATRLSFSVCSSPKDAPDEKKCTPAAPAPNFHQGDFAAVARAGGGRYTLTFAVPAAAAAPVAAFVGCMALGEEEARFPAYCLPASGASKAVAPAADRRPPPRAADGGPTQQPTQPFSFAFSMLDWNTGNVTSDLAVAYAALGAKTTELAFCTGFYLAAAPRREPFTLQTCVGVPLGAENCSDVKTVAGTGASGTLASPIGPEGVWDGSVQANYTRELAWAFVGEKAAIDRLCKN